MPELVYLVKRKRKLKNDKSVEYYVARPGLDGWPEKGLGKTNRYGGITKDRAREMVKEYAAEIEGGHRPLEGNRNLTFGDLVACYAERRRRGESGNGYRKGVMRLSETTINDHLMTIRYLAYRFGDRHVSTVTENEAEAFFSGMESGELVGASKKSTVPGQNAIRHHVRNAKAIYNYLIKVRLVKVNPFADFDGTAIPTKDDQYVSLDSLEKVIAVCPTHGWAALFALCRLGGLRRGEALDLTWSGSRVDSWGVEHQVGVGLALGGRIRMMGNHKMSRPHRYREVAICPRLREILLAALTDGTDLVCGDLHRPCVWWKATKIMEAAGASWPKPFKTLRSSARADLDRRGLRTAVVDRLMGHTKAVAAKHYDLVTPEEFQIAAA